MKASTSSNSVVRSALWYPSDLPIYDENIEGGFTRVDWLAANPICKYVIQKIRQ